MTDTGPDSIRNGALSAQQMNEFGDSAALAEILLHISVVTTIVTGRFVKKSICPILYFVSLMISMAEIDV